MARIIIEKRQFKDNNTGVVTEYDYIAVAGTGEAANYEVQLKNLVQSEKMALRMIGNMENPTGEVETRKATEDEAPTVTKTTTDNDGNWLDQLN